MIKRRQARGGKCGVKIPPMETYSGKTTLRRSIAASNLASFSALRSLFFRLPRRDVRDAALPALPPPIRRLVLLLFLPSRLPSRWFLSFLRAGWRRFLPSPRPGAPPPPSGIDNKNKNEEGENVLAHFCISFKEELNPLPYH